MHRSGHIKTEELHVGASADKDTKLEFEHETVLSIRLAQLTSLIIAHSALTVHFHHRRLRGWQNEGAMGGKV